jgi:hypothetical protein
MKEIEFESTTPYGNKITKSCFSFTDKERDHFHRILKGYEKAKIEEFLDQIQAWIGVVYLIRQQPKPAPTI